MLLLFTILAILLLSSLPTATTATTQPVPYPVPPRFVWDQFPSVSVLILAAYFPQAFDAQPYKYFAVKYHTNVFTPNGAFNLPPDYNNFIADRAVMDDWQELNGAGVHAHFESGFKLCISSNSGLLKNPQSPVDNGVGVSEGFWLLGSQAIPTICVVSKWAPAQLVQIRFSSGTFSVSPVMACFRAVDLGSSGEHHYQVRMDFAEAFVPMTFRVDWKNKRGACQDYSFMQYPANSSIPATGLYNAIDGLRGMSASNTSDSWESFRPADPGRDGCYKGDDWWTRPQTCQATVQTEVYTPEPEVALMPLRAVMKNVLSRLEYRPTDLPNQKFLRQIVTCLGCDEISTLSWVPAKTTIYLRRTSFANYDAKGTISFDCVEKTQPSQCAMGFGIASAVLGFLAAIAAPFTAGTSLVAYGAAAGTGAGAISSVLSGVGSGVCK